VRRINLTSITSCAYDLNPPAAACFDETGSLDIRSFLVFYFLSFFFQKLAFVEYLPSLIQLLCILCLSLVIAMHKSSETIFNRRYWL
jgi:hypothetical protein